MSGRKRIHLCPIWLVKTATAIQEGKTTLKEACQSAQVIVRHKGGFSSVRTQAVTPSTVRRALHDEGIEVSLMKGRPRTNVLEEYKQKIISAQKELKMGVSKVYEQIKSESASVPKYQEITHSMVYKTLDENSLLQYKKPLNPVPVYRCRYEASYADLIWHTDLHDFHDQYLIAFIDDYSRYVTYCEVIPNKYSSLTKTVLDLAITANNRPFSIWTDNGGEFDGEFKKYLQDNGIKQVRSKAYNPQQNGKCERFWRTAEKCQNIEELKKWLNVYNNAPHFGLPRITVNKHLVHVTPYQRYYHGQKWNPSIPPTWVVDGVTKPFVPYGTD